MKLTQGILGPGRGKVGPIICSVWKGINYAKGYFKPPQPRTGPQVYSRALMSLLGEQLSYATADIFQPFIDPLVSDMSGFNKAIQFNRPLQPEYLPAFLDNTVTLNPELISYLNGPLTITTFTSCTYDTATGDVTFTWPTTTEGNQQFEDTIIGIFVRSGQINKIHEGQIVSKARYCYSFITDPTPRLNGTIGITASTGLELNTCHAYLIATRMENEKPFNSPTANKFPTAP